MGAGGKSARRAGATSLRAGGAVDPVARARCHVVAELVDDLLHLAGKRPALPRNRRCVATHARQIAIYLSHVVLQVSLTDLGIVFGRDRTTASYSCHVVEDLRDDPEFDAFVSVIERVIVSALRIGQDQADA